MTYLRSWRHIFKSRERRYNLLAIAVLLVLALTHILVISLALLPAAKARQENISQLASIEKDLNQAEEAYREAPIQLRTQIATAKTRLAETVNMFLSEAEAAEVLDKLYEWAADSGIDITNLQSLPISEGKKGTYDVRSFRLQAEGNMEALMDFMSRIEEPSSAGFALTNVNIAESEGLHVLNLDITLLTSPYAFESRAPARVTPKATPTLVPTPVVDEQLQQRLQEAWAAEDWAEAISLIEQALAITPDNTTMIQSLYAARVNYGYQLLAAGDPRAATVQFDLALALQPGGQEAMAGLQQANAMLVSTPGPQQELERRLLEAWSAQDWTTAIEVIEQFLAANPDDTIMTQNLYAALVNLGYKLMAEGKLEEAKEAFSRALAIKPNGEEAMAGLQALMGESPVPTATLAPTTIPTPFPTASPVPQYVVYTVVSGDTLYSIARRYGTTVEAIMMANGLTNYTIYPGQPLLIPTP